MNLLCALFYPETPPKLSVERFRVITHHVQSTALCGTIRSEGAHDHVAAYPDGLDYGLNIFPAFVSINEEMENGAVVPHVERLKWQGNLSNIANHPAYAVRDPGQASFRRFYRGARHIEQGELFVVEGEKIIHKS